MSLRSNRRYWNLVADRLETDRTGDLLRRGQAQLHQWRQSRPAAASERYWDRWDALIQQGPRAVVSMLRDPSDEADTMRSCAPFVGAVSHQERWRLVREH